MTNNLVRPLFSNPVPPESDKARVDAIFAQVAEKFGFVPDGLRLYSLSPELLENFLSAVGYFTSHPRISQKLLGTIRYLASARVNCAFCIDFNEAYLTHLGVDLEQIRAARSDISFAPITDDERPLLDMAMKSTEEPENVSAADIDNAKSKGWTERDIFDVVALASTNRAFTTILKTFKVEQQGVFG